MFPIEEQLFHVCIDVHHQRNKNQNQSSQIEFQLIHFLDFSGSKIAPKTISMISQFKWSNNNISYELT